MAFNQSKWRTIFFSLGLFFVIFSGGLALLMTQACDTVNPAIQYTAQTIKSCLLLPNEGLQVLWQTKAKGNPEMAPEYGVFTRYELEDSPGPVAHVAIAQHPFMATASNNMHNDAYVSDVYSASGPHGVTPEIVTRSQGFGGYGTIAFDRAGRIIGVYSNGRGFQLEVMDPLTLEETLSYDLPDRAWYFPLQGVLPWKYIGAGMYFYLDNEDRAIVPSNKNSIMVIQVPEAGSDQDFKLLREYDLAEHVVKMDWPKLDSVAWVLPEWNGERYWYATIEGMIGTVELESGQVDTTRIGAEIIENSFAVGEEGVFIISDSAMYRLSYREQDGITIDWRTAYDPGPAPKPGHITRGSGSSVTLVGAPSDGFVVVTDNADPRIHLEFYRRSNGEKVCSVPLFEEGKSGTDLSVLAFEQADTEGQGLGKYSVLVENNWGHHSFPVPDPNPGITRVDAIRQADGSIQCQTVWNSQEKGIAAAKLSLGSGLLYMYMSDDTAARGWYFAALDFRTGETVFRQHTGMGHGYNAWQGVLFIHPDNGALYTTTIFGLIMMRDKMGETGDTVSDNPAIPQNHRALSHND